MINVMLASVYNYLMGDGLPFYGLSGHLLSVENTTKSVIFFFYHKYQKYRPSLYASEGNITCLLFWLTELSKSFLRIIDNAIYNSKRWPFKSKIFEYM